MTYKKIIDLFKEACDSHLGINAFKTGPLSTLDSSVDTAYPYVFLRPMNSPGMQNKARILNFEMYILDAVRLSNESPTDIISRLEVVAYDINNFFNQGPYQQDIGFTINSIVPVNEAFQDRAYGWMANVSVRTAYSPNYCLFPKLT
jgi:hypothetical protein